jgi:hypothetical protein
MPTSSAPTIEAAEVTSEFIRRRVPEYGVVELRDQGELVGGLLSRQELEHYWILLGQEIEVFRAGKFPDDIVAALEDSCDKYALSVK